MTASDKSHRANDRSNQSFHPAELASVSKLLDDVHSSVFSPADSLKSPELPPEKQGVQTKNGLITSVRKGEDYFSIDYDGKGRPARITEHLGPNTRIMEAGKDFSSAILSPDGTLTLSKAGKVEEARTLEGGHRQFKYDEHGQLIQIIDRIHTNSGRDLEETTTRVGNSNIWDFKSNFGDSGQRTNVVVDEKGDFKADLIKNSRPDDLINKDNSDALHPDLAKAREEMVEAAKAKGLGNFAEKWGKMFEQRCLDQGHRQIKTATDEQIATTYHYLQRILSESSRISLADRKLLFETALKEYAEPQKYINQGEHPDCPFAMTERHVVQTHPDDHARVLWEAISNQVVKSKDGRRHITMADVQIRPDSESLQAARDGNTQVGEWSYSNKIFQLAAISIGYGGYRGNGYDMDGGTDDQAKRANRFIDGEGNMVILQNGNLSTFEKVAAYLKNHGTIGLFDYIGGHAMAITDAKTSHGKHFIYIDNWWNGESEGWKQV